MRVLLVEDQAEVADALAREFRRLGFDADRAGCIAEAEEALRESSYGLTLVDRITACPTATGWRSYQRCGALTLTCASSCLPACDRREDIISGLDCGADDYVTKPFHFDELMARIRTVLRRGGRDRPPPILLGALRFDPYTRDVSINGISTPIHGRELALLEILVTNAGRMVDRRTILREIYGGADVVVPKALNMLVVRLRRWVVEVDAGVAIHSLRGVGYMLQKAPD